MTKSHDYSFVPGIPKGKISLEKALAVFSGKPHLRQVVLELNKLLENIEPSSNNIILWSLPRYAFTLEIMRKIFPVNANVLDLGSNSCFSYLVSQRTNYRWTPTTLSSELIEFKNKKTGSIKYRYTPEIIFLNGKKIQLGQTNKYDAVTLFEIIEHFDFNPCSCFGSVNDLLAINGLLVLSTPNACSGSALMRLLNGGSPYQTPVMELGPMYHKKEYTPWEVKQMLLWAGFEIQSFFTQNVYINDIKGWKAFVHRACILLSAILSFSPAQARTIIQHWGSTTFIIAKKNKNCDWSRPMFQV